MGLNTTHGCWDGAYSAFMRWRQKVAAAAGLPPLDLMEGFYVAGSPLHDPMCRSGLDSTVPSPRLEGLPIKWECLKPDAIHLLLHHSDCEGEIRWEDCDAIADSLEAIHARMPDEDAGGHIGFWKDKTQTFINGLRLAARKKENVQFH